MNAVDNDQRTALQSAAWQGHDTVVSLLLDNDAHVDHTCNQGATALCIAAQEGHEEVVRVLLRHQANPNHADQFGRTPVRVALKSGHHSVIRLLEDFGAAPVSCSKSRSSSSNSSSEMRTPAATVAGSSTVSPGGTAAPTVFAGSGSGSGSGAGQGQGQGATAVAAQHSSPSDSPESTFDRRKSYQSNNSSKSSSNMTTSTNQSTQSGPQQLLLQQHCPPPSSSKEGGECLTFTQQLQQCSMGKNRSRPISRVLSPVSEPQTPVQSPTVSPVTEVVRLPSMVLPHNVPGNCGTAMSTDSEAGGVGGVTVTSTGRVRVDLGGGKELLGNRPATTAATATAAASNTATASASAAVAATAVSSASPALERNLNLLAPSPVKCAVSKQDKISATINIITNPNADMLATPEEPIWQMQPAQVKATRGPPPPPPLPNNGISSPTAPALPPRVPLVDSPTKILLGRGTGHAETRSPEARRKRNGIVTNPKVTKGSNVNNAHYNKLSAEDKKNGVAKGGTGNSCGGKGFANIQPHSPGSGRDGNGKAIRPTGLPLKKETPM